MTTYEEELQEQRKWRLKPDWADYPGFDELVADEFLTHEKQGAFVDKRLRDFIGFSAMQVPFYRRQWQELGIDIRDIRGLADLSRLPILTKHDIQAHFNDLLPHQTPPGHQAKYKIKSSGTTGEPVTVAHSGISRSFHALFKQRQLRWFRYDPMGLLAQIRPPQDLPTNAAGEPLQKGETCSEAGWPFVGKIFHTGRFIGFNDHNTAEDKVAWLEKHQPDYLLGQSAQLEQLALAAKDIGFTFRLKGIEAISQQLTPDMAAVIESVFGAPVHMNYGLNEAGLVAVRCPEGDRYHIHTEHCITEIVDQDGVPCKPGESGRLLVTVFGNLAMPLIRYDTDDLAEVSEGPCPCGRTLPTFREIHGRYRRTALLPPGVWDYWVTLQRFLGETSIEELANLQQYQLHHHRDGSFTLNVVAAGDLHPAFREKIREYWRRGKEGEPAPLTIELLDEIYRRPGGKFQNFISDFFPDYRNTAEDA
jgi:phenylacetate-CoA ligase